MKINLNADCGESFGNWTLGRDADLLKIVTSANIACGFHAGDADVMRHTVALAVENGVSIGAHPGFEDLKGFGRRQMQLKPQEIENLVAYQIGALQSIARFEGASVTHVKAHGALSNMACDNALWADAIARAVKAVDPSLILLSIAGTELSRAGTEMGLKIAEEIFADRNYTPKGLLVSRAEPNAMVKGGEASLAHVRRMIEAKGLVATDGTIIPTDIHSICMHGDEETALAAATHLRNGLEVDGHEILTLPELIT